MKRIQVIALLSCAGALLACSTTAPAVGARPSATPSIPSALRPYYRQTLEWKPCHDTLECATFEVPLDYAKPAGPRITITAARAVATGTSRGSIVANPGGPGGSGISYIEDPQYAVSLTARRNFDLVSFDPRGVGESTPLWCLRGAQLDAFLEIDPTPDTAVEEQAVQRAGARLAAACQQENAPLMQHLSAVDIARDMDVLRGLLGEARLRYLGKSWGTALGKVYAALFPTRVGSFVLDGAVDLTLTSKRSTYEQSQGFEDAVHRFAAWCVKRTNCPLGTTEASAIQRLVRFVHELDAQPLKTTNPARPLTEAEAYTAVVGPLYISDGGFDWLLTGLKPALLYQDGTALQTIYDWFVERDADGTYTSNGNTAIYATNCLDDAPAFSSIASVRTAAKAWAKVMPFMGAGMAWSELPCAKWPYHASVDVAKLRVANVPPALVIGGTHDPATPLRWARSLTKQWPGAALLIRDGDGHTSYANGSLCVDRAVDTFLLSSDIWHPDIQASGTMCDATIG